MGIFTKLMKCVFLLYILWRNVYCVKVSTCNELLITTNCTADDHSRQLLFTSKFKINANLNSANVTYPNEITFFDYSIQTFNNSGNVTDEYAYLEYGFNNAPAFSWNFTKNVKINFPNSGADFSRSVVGPFQHYGYSFMPILINNGELYSGAGVLNDNDCFGPSGGISDIDLEVDILACCIGVKETEIPDNIEYICESFESKSQMIDIQTNEIIVDFAAAIEVIPKGFSMKVTKFMSSYYTHYQFAPWYSDIWGYENCTGNSTILVDECIFEYYPDRTDYLRFILLGLWEPVVDAIFVAKIMHRNGIFLKEDYTPFTPENSCWTESGPMPYYTETRKTNVSACCVKFNKTLETITTFQPPSKTTSSTKICHKYHSETQLSDNSIFLEVEYILNTTKMVVNIVNYFSDNNVITQLESYSVETFSQTCRVTSTAPTNLCYFDILDNQQYELQLRASIFPDGFNMTTLIENNGQLITPFLTTTNPCRTEKYSYNGYGNSNISASTTFCCAYFN